MITKTVIDKEIFYFLLIKNGKTIALVQKGNNAEHVLVEIKQKEFESEVFKTIERNLLCEQESAIMSMDSNWDYMKDFCFKAANLYSDFYGPIMIQIVKSLNVGLI